MMKELSYHVLDIANNSLRAKATQVEIEIEENISKDFLRITIKDNGQGMSPEFLSNIKNPFVTTRTFRKVGLGIPFLEDTCRACDGELVISSKIGQGTVVRAKMKYSHIDRPPLGDMSSTIASLIASSRRIDIVYRHWVNSKLFSLTTRQLKEILGEDLSLDMPSIHLWIRDYIKENVNELYIQR